MGRIVEPRGEAVAGTKTGWTVRRTCGGCSGQASRPCANGSRRCRSTISPTTGN